jgi:hypothetical protein
MTTRKQSAAASGLAVGLGVIKATIEGPIESKNLKAKKIKAVSYCIECEELISFDTKALNCDRCKAASAWKCAKCLGLSDAAYDSLAASSLHWFCNPCERLVTSNADKEDIIVAAMEKILEKISNIELMMPGKVDIAAILELDKRIKSLELKEVGTTSNELTDAGAPATVTNVPVPKSVAELVTEAVVSQTEEENDILRRRNNIIIYKAQENDSDDHEVRLASDQSFFSGLYEESLGLGPVLDNAVKIQRLGKRRDDNSARPMLIQLSSDAVKDKLMSNLRKLKNADERYKKISVAHDLTAKQRAAVKTALSQAQQAHSEATETNQQENWVFRVVGSQRTPRVIKFKLG